MKKKLIYLLFSFFFLVIFFSHSEKIYATANSDTMVGYWKLDESTAGSTVVDSSGDSNSGTPNGATGGNNLPQPNSSVPSSIVFSDPKSLNFDGTDDYVDFGSGSDLQLSGVLTITAWIKLNSVYNSVQTIMSNTSSNGSGGNYLFEYGRTAGKLGFIQNGSVDALSTNTITDNNWHHVAVVRSGSTSAWTIKFYIDGSLDSTTATGNNPGLLPGNAAIGRAGGFNGNYFNGNMDDVRMYKRALSLAEISDLAAGKHTSATWNGGTSTDYENVNNWSTGAIPDPYTLVTIGSGTNQPTMTANESLAGLVINSGSTVNLAGFNLSMNDTGTFTNNGTLSLQGGETITNITNSPNSGTITYTGSGSYNSLNFGNTYNNLTFNGTGNWKHTALLTINGNLTITAGTLNSSGQNITLKGNWNNTGTYTNGSNTVTLSGTNQTISNPNTFYNLTKTVTSGDTLTFSSGDTQTITNNLTLKGAASNLLSLRSLTTNTQWKINPQGTRAISYLDVKDSNNVNVTAIDATDGTNGNSGNNTNWTFTNPTPTPAQTTTSSSSGNSASSTATPTCTDTKPSGIPNLFQIATSPTTATLYFSPVNPSNNYVISYGTSQTVNQYGASFTQGATTGVVLYTINNLNPNTQYYFKVRGGNNCMPGDWSNIVSATTTNASETVVPTSIPEKKLEIVQQKQTATNPPSQQCVYKVQPGDSLWTIAENKLGDGAKYQLLIDQNKTRYPDIASFVLPEWELKINCSPQTNQTKTVTQSLSEGYSLTIKVQNDGQAVQGATVELHSVPMRTITDKNGIARFTNVVKGEHTLFLSYQGYTGNQQVALNGDKKDVTINTSIKLTDTGFASPQVKGVIGLLIGIIVFFIVVIAVLLKKKKA